MQTRSALYVPADHERAMAKAESLEVDILIFDLEDGVAPQKKAIARAAVVGKLSDIPSAGALKIVRINHHSASYYADDIAALANAPMGGIMLSKVSGAQDIDDALRHLAQHHRADLPIWCNVETPLGVANAFEIAAHPAVRGLVAGTNDLANDLRIERTPDSAALMHSLQRIVLAARAHGRIVLDGTFIDFNDEAGLKAEASHGRMLGFDGKTLVHPKQIAVANAAFSPSDAQREEARAIIKAFEAAMTEHKAVTLLDGRMLERLHYERAKSLLNET
jgi:(3S)-malyl-CoA thioesterase